MQRANEHSALPAPEVGVPHEYRQAAELALRTKGSAMSVEAQLIDMAKRKNKPTTGLPTRQQLADFKRNLSRQVSIAHVCWMLVCR